MRFGRFFVTSAAILSTLAIVACSKGEQKADVKRAERLKQNKALLAEGNALIAQTDALRKELDSAPLNIKIQDVPIENPVAKGKTINHKTIGESYNWERLTQAERQLAKEKLAALMTGLTRILEIDAKKGVWVENIKKINERRVATEAYQTSLGLFETQYGEQYNPQSAGSGPLYKNL